MECYVLNILLSSPSRTVFLWCCPVRYSALAVGAGTIPHQKTPKENSILRSGVDNNIIIKRIHKQKQKDNNTTQKS